MYAIRDCDLSKLPERLFEIPQAPKRLRIAGTLVDPDLYYLAVVGARKYTRYGAEAVRSIISGLAGAPIVIVSGLALGIDALAHEAALAAGLPTLAFPGSGLSPAVMYPRTNATLARDIVNAGGALVSEYADDFRATMWSFPQRNRLMAGISHGTLVVEAEEKSGSLITARLALEYNRDVFAVPGSIFSSASGGPNSLVKRGAIPVTSAADILTHWNLAEAIASATLAERIPEDATDAEKAILMLLTEPQERDVLIRDSELDTDEANIALATLEIKGLIGESLGKVALK